MSFAMIEIGDYKDKLMFHVLPDKLVVFEAGRVQGEVGHQVVDRVLGIKPKK
jgi:hypothetical protein